MKNINNQYKIDFNVISLINFVNAYIIFFKLNEEFYDFSEISQIIEKELKSVKIIKIERYYLLCFKNIFINLKIIF